MKEERPILFTPENAQKVFEGTKTQTRRIMKPQPLGPVSRSGTHGFLLSVPMMVKGCEWPITGIDCPWGGIGDRLWVREAGWIAQSKMAFAHKAINTPPPGGYKSPNGEPYKACPSIHMPKWACRTWLEITDVRVERVQEISEEDAKAEGAAPLMSDGLASYKDGFQLLWSTINGSESWYQNPWVWVLTFRRIKQECFR